MDDKRITADEVMAILADDVRVLSKQIAKAMNNARDGAIINDSELPIWKAHNAFRKAITNKAVGLVQEKHEAFSPSAKPDAESRGQEGHRDDDERDS